MGYFAESFTELYNADGWIDMGMYSVQAHLRLDGGQ